MSFEDNPADEDPHGQCRHEIHRLQHALEESVKLQSHYAALLNQYDGGRRMQFKDAEAWMARVAEVEARNPPSQETPVSVSTKERVLSIVTEQLGVREDQLKDETHFVNDLGADSLDQVELIMELEEEFDITIPDEKAEKVRTMADLTALVEELTKD